MAEAGSQSGSADITIEANGKYTATKTLQANPGDTIVWHVQNNMASEVVTVEVGRFKKGSSVTHPVERNPSVTLAPGQSGDMSTVVRQSAASGKHKYKISVNGDVATDPELEIP